MNKELTKSELDFLTKESIENNPFLTKIIEHIIYNYTKLNNDNSKFQYQNELVYKQMENIINNNNKLLFHFKLSLVCIIIIILLHLYYVFTLF